MPSTTTPLYLSYAVQLFAGILASAVLIFSLAALIGHAPQLEGLHDWASLTRLALHTALVLILFHMGILTYIFNRNKSKEIFFISLSVDFLLLLLTFAAWTLIHDQETLISRSALPISALLAGFVISALLTSTISIAFSLAKTTTSLRKANELNTAIMASTPYLIISTDKDGTVTLFNKAAELSLGYSEQEVVGKTTPKIWHDMNEIVQRSAELSQEMNRPVQPGFDVFITKPTVEGAESREWTFIRKDRSRFPGNLTATPLRDGNGNINGFLGVIEDLTARKEAEREQAIIEESLLVSEQRHRLLVEGVADYGIYWLDVNGNINSWNLGAYNLKGYTEQEIINKNFSIFFTEEDRAENLPMLALNIAAEKGKYEAEGYRVRKDGTRFWAHVIIEPIYDSSGKIIGFAKISHDETKRKQQDDLQQKVIGQLVNSNTELERFAYIASHDMQEPIRMVTNFSAILDKDYRGILDETGREYLKLIKESGLRMHDLVEDLLAYSRLTNESAKSKIFSGEDVLGGALGNLKGLIKESKAQITHDPLPELYGNPVQILSLLQNLIANAIKYQVKNNIPRIRIAMEDETTEWRISVEDNGLGIKDEFRDKIFLPFRRLHTWEQIQGTGLGLSICKKIVENHGGQISVTSAEGKGSTFTFTLRKNIVNIT